ncbi:hypothetical protein [Longimicrobium terrae]|uniref:Lipocalin-like domain-containing protein n=1 Tax=Longimicrobium terrae TaxID=1639882 RepID=A0A841H557_9BACT|nr:hypothetical protein [Longimicrobium terrae]MBB4638864.1 hypothetical protein [Longimicrobium terrae]MBB6073103.1 hypothetical protein [Longimicrobium terrae]NNC30206.1 hypothetical protein [Longimicrobium terrae]
MRRQRILSLSLLAVLAGVLPSALQAQAQFTGSWMLNRQQSDDINAKINTTVARMNLVVRQIARPRLRSTNTAYPHLSVFTQNNTVRVDMQGRPSVSSPSTGTPVMWQRETGRTCTQLKGDCVRVTSTTTGNQITQTFTAEDGQRVNVYTLSPDGNTMNMNVTITSPRLPQPLTYRLVYNRHNN